MVVRVSPMEGVEVGMFGGHFADRRVLLTGHTGFKGSCLALWLRALGANVTGISLRPESFPNHWDILALDVDSHHVDIRDAGSVKRIIARSSPEIVFHMAAQSLVRRSYREPVDTWSTNVIGTMNVMDACRTIDGLRAIVVITTDKCYENKEWLWGYREVDRLGGLDPYSASKAATELAVASVRHSFYNKSGMAQIATARAGNVIGGGDWSEDRLIPDLVRAIASGGSLEIRSPDATRPWQHVLDCLSGYLLLAQRLFEGGPRFDGPWNFGPDREGNRTVEQVLIAMKNCWPRVAWNHVDVMRPHEAQLLHLDSTKARERLPWRPVYTFEEAAMKTAHWYQRYLDEGRAASHDQLTDYSTLARERGVVWAATHTT